MTKGRTNLIEDVEILSQGITSGSTGAIVWHNIEGVRHDGQVVSRSASVSSLSAVASTLTLSQRWKRTLGFICSEVQCNKKNSASINRECRSLKRKSTKGKRGGPDRISGYQPLDLD